MDGKERCEWCGDDPLYMKYHDDEWGQPVHDDRCLFEMLILEGAQAGLSWITILKRRDGYRRAFDNFDVIKVSSYDEEMQEKLRNNPEIIRNRLKIKSAVINAAVFISIQNEFKTFDRYIWGFVNNKPVKNHFKNASELPANNELSERISKDLKKRGMLFVGSTIIYAYLQSVGIINDHTVNCFRYSE